MFSKIRRRLTLFYTGLMVAFLLTFVGVIYIGMTWAIYSEGKQEVRLFAEEEAREHLVIFKHKDLLPNMLQENYRDGSGRMFFFAFDAYGSLINAAEPYSALREPVLAKIRSWSSADGDVELATIVLSSGDEAILMLSAQRVYDGDMFLGTVYVGRDITPYYQVLKNFLVVTTVVSFAFLILVSLAGYIMAGRAMTPIRESFRRQREFVADASHELRTPLSVLLTSVDAVQSDDGSSMSPFAQQVLSDMKDEIRKMSKIVSDLLTLARGDAGAFNLIKEQFNLKAVAEQVVRSLQPLAGEKGIELSLQSPDPVTVYADRERLSQLLLILLDNGIKYTPPGGQVKAILEPPAKNRAELRIIVQDTGIGIAPEHQALIFERFYRIDKARSRELGGTGLGLAIARWIAESHGGAITVMSRPGQGSTFTVTLPQPVGG
ncbi:integral membrane sensor signal transduction histidine kinase [Thermosinus carboxydivorans Nor1]|uniref:histidine kinase n=1 Tax=Thermosinus carboxydivorans Nor1 TaxID=401526 RepID=A1HQC3_9FIRM|nr:HAMP domain-containing sensor histidine kinase [Thermosinus carboxydivorans]EAX47730.1 integral membrane sensor signal transduction histidine kinase [Thermosinus carboxydivorans Nor1]